MAKQNLHNNFEILNSSAFHAIGALDGVALEFPLVFTISASTADGDFVDFSTGVLWTFKFCLEETGL